MDQPITLIVQIKYAIAGLPNGGLALPTADRSLPPSAAGKHFPWRRRVHMHRYAALHDSDPPDVGSPLNWRLLR